MRYPIGIFVGLLITAPLSGDESKFENEIAPLLITRCLECHGPNDPHGGLDLTSHAAAKQGGDSGEAIVPGRPEESYLVERVAAGEMPPEDKGKPLSESEVKTLSEWIASGAKWPADRVLSPFERTTNHRAGYDWWSLQPLSKTPLPSIGQTEWPRADFDHFVLARLEQARLAPSNEAERRTLIRRLYFDLLGLPPEPEAIKAFIADDDPGAYENLIDELLASPHYGERWARHWLDVARFGESDGFEYDRPRPNAWPYRDWVINALNHDMPYNEFARRQIAGDVLYPGDGSAAIATSFLVCGAFDGLKPAGDKMRQIMRQDELDEMVAVASQAFLGLTINCARCHDHKFDPIRQEDYYRFASSLSGVHRGDRNVTLGDVATIDHEIAAAQEQLTALEQPIRTELLNSKSPRPSLGEVRERGSRIGIQPIALWTFDNGLQDQLGNLDGKAHGGAKIADGKLQLNGTDAYVSTAPLSKGIREKTLVARVKLANLTQRGGAPISLQTTDGNTFDAIVFGERDPQHWMAGSDFFRRTKSFQAEPDNAADDQFVDVAIVYSADGTITGYRNGKPYGKPYNGGAVVTHKAGQSQILFGLRHGTSAAGRRMLAGEIDQAALYDRALSAEDVAAAAGMLVVTEAELVAAMTDDQRRERDTLKARLAELQAEKNRFAVSKVYTVTPEGAPVVHLLKRGSPFNKGDIVPPGGVPAIKGLPADFGLDPSAAEADRRRKLADWITDDNNPLFARTIVNRVWHYHFGTGLVTTPNDLGFSGGKASHPAVLDTLALQLIADGWSLKKLHKRILMSATYRQASQHRADAAAIDADNRLLWRKAPLRLEAEVVRDTVLHVAGQLNPARGGPGFEDFTKVNEKNTWRYDPADRVGAEFNRRSIYRTWARGGRNPLLDTFDCPDPSTTAPDRGETTTPLQALVLMNNSFMLRMSDHFVERLASDAGGQPADQIRRAYQLAFGRQPEPHEIERAVKFADEHGMSALCRVIFNANEFLYVE